MGSYTNKPKDNFTIVPNALITDTRLSWSAKGVYSYMASKPTGWQFYEREIAENTSAGLDATRTAIKQLIETGWLERSMSRNSAGQNAGYDYTINIKAKHGKPKDGEPDTNKTNKNKTNNNVISKDITQAAPEFAIKPSSTIGKSRHGDPGVQTLCVKARKMGFVIGQLDTWAAKRMIKKHTFTKVMEQLELSQEIRLKDPFAPQVLNLVELEKKWLHVSEYVRKNGVDGIPQAVLDEITAYCQEYADRQKLPPGELKKLIELKKYRYLNEGGIWK